MLYLLDANILITAERNYYPIDQVPEFWEWLLYNANGGRIKIPLEILAEVLKGGKDKDKDQLLEWLKRDGVTSALTAGLEEVPSGLVRRVITDGYGPNLDDSALEVMGRDPILIAYGLVDLSTRTIVTNEVSAPGRQAQNRKIPNVCATFGIPYITIFGMNRALGFSTSWNTSS